MNVESFMLSTVTALILVSGLLLLTGGIFIFYAVADWVADRVFKADHPIARTLQIIFLGLVCAWAIVTYIWP